MTLADPRVEQPSVKRYYLAPSATTAAGKSALTCWRLMGSGSNSYLYRALVVDRPLTISPTPDIRHRARSDAVHDLGLAEARR